MPLPDLEFNQYRIVFSDGVEYKIVSSHLLSAVTEAVRDNPGRVIIDALLVRTRKNPGNIAQNPAHIGQTIGD